MLPKLSPRLYVSARSLTTAPRRLPSTFYTDPSSGYEPAAQATPSDLTESQREILESALRVDQAGEIAANYIYQGQMAVLGQDKRLGSLIQVSLG
jgi:3-demethoxyubiquinol 3-hydroxylase